MTVKCGYDTGWWHCSAARGKPVLLARPCGRRLTFIGFLGQYSSLSLTASRCSLANVPIVDASGFNGHELGHRAPAAGDCGWEYHSPGGLSCIIRRPNGADGVGLNFWCQLWCQRWGMDGIRGDAMPQNIGNLLILKESSRVLIPPYAGSNPATPAIRLRANDSTGSQPPAYFHIVRFTFRPCWVQASILAFSVASALLGST